LSTGTYSQPVNAGPPSHGVSPASRSVSGIDYLLEKGLAGLTIGEILESACTASSSDRPAS
jgi:hypothetical protein